MDLFNVFEYNQHFVAMMNVMSVVEQRGLSNRHPKASKTNYQKAQKSLSEEFHKYKDEGGELKWQQWLHVRKELTNG